MRDGTCSRCGGQEVLEGVRLKVPAAGSVDDVHAVVSPTSGMFRQQTGSPLRAWICAACGFSELYVADPATLAARWRAGDR